MSADHMHVPVCSARTIELLSPALSARHSLFVDATLGLGGHSYEILSRFPDCHVIGIDRDPDALAHARQRLSQFGDRLETFHGTYDQIDAALAGRRANGILFDLGVSSMQIDQPERGFSYRFDAPIDMRMNPEEERSAHDFLATCTEDELTRVIQKYGEDKYARRIARAIVSNRAIAITSTAALTQVIHDAVSNVPYSAGHPAKRTFQALRIHVNDELGILERALPRAVESLAIAGRIVVLSYHSLEDRIVKRLFQSATQPSVPPELPFIPDDARPWLRPLTRGAEVASAEERAANPRAASVRLRAAEKVRDQNG